jgi:hypothetical protein
MRPPDAPRPARITPCANRRIGEPLWVARGPRFPMALLADPPVSHDGNVVAGANRPSLSTDPDFDATFVWSGIERGNLAVV